MVDRTVTSHPSGLSSRPLRGAWLVPCWTTCSLLECFWKDFVKADWKSRNWKNERMEKSKAAEFFFSRPKLQQRKNEDRAKRCREQRSGRSRCTTCRLFMASAWACASTKVRVCEWDTVRESEWARRVAFRSWHACNREREWASEAWRVRVHFLLMSVHVCACDRDRRKEMEDFLSSLFQKDFHRNCYFLSRRCARIDLISFPSLRLMRKKAFSTWSQLALYSSLVLIEAVGPLPADSEIESIAS